VTLAIVLFFGCSVAGFAAESGKLVEKDGKYVFVESMDPSMKLLLERSVKSGMITQEEYNKVIQDSEERSQLLAPSFKGWYDRGFNLSFNDNAFFLKIRFRAQLRDFGTMPGATRVKPRTFPSYSEYSATIEPTAQKIVPVPSM